MDISWEHYRGSVRSNVWYLVILLFSSLCTLFPRFPLIWFSSHVPLTAPKSVACKNSKPPAFPSSPTPAGQALDGHSDFWGNGPFPSLSSSCLFLFFSYPHRSRRCFVSIALCHLCKSNEPNGYGASLTQRDGWDKCEGMVPAMTQCRIGEHIQL